VTRSADITGAATTLGLVAIALAMPSSAFLTGRPAGSGQDDDRRGRGGRRGESTDRELIWPLLAGSEDPALR
jgi:hypothetical protein